MRRRRIETVYDLVEAIRRLAAKLEGEERAKRRAKKEDSWFNPEGDWPMTTFPLGDKRREPFFKRQIDGKDAQGAFF
jgi:hypothetical protein